MAFGTKIQSTSGSTSATFAAAPKAGNLLVFLAASTANVTFTAPTNWTGGTEVHASGGSSRGMQCSWKISDGSESGAISPASGSPTACVMVEYEGPFQAVPIDVENNQLTASGTTHTSPSVTPTSGKRRFMVGGCAVDATGRTWSTEQIGGVNAAEDVDVTWVLFSRVVSPTSGSYSAVATVSGAAVIGEAAIMIFIPAEVPLVTYPDGSEWQGQWRAVSQGMTPPQHG